MIHLDNLIQSRNFACKHTYCDLSNFSYIQAVLQRQSKDVKQLDTAQYISRFALDRTRNAL